jgi:hypothetical protein
MKFCLRVVSTFDLAPRQGASLVRRFPRLNPGLNGAKISSVWNVLLPEGAEEFSSGLQPHKRQVNARRFDGRMVFVPEGQHGRSQARSAWRK